MRNKQRGVTFIGWLILLTPMAIVAYAGIRLAPVYLNYMKVARTLSRVSTEVGPEAAQAAVTTAIERHFEIEEVDFPTSKDIKVTRQGKSWQMEAAYDDQAPLFANLAITVSFDKIVTIGSTGGID